MADVNFVAEELRESFIKHKRKVNPTYNLMVAPFRDKFLKAAEHCIKSGIEPDLYVKYHFDKFGAEKMVPQFLYSEGVAFDSVEFVKESEQKTSIPPDIHFDVQKQYLYNGVVNCKRSVESVLMDDELKLTPWFRILITKEPVQEVIDKYRIDAARYLDSNKKLVEFLKSKNLDLKRISSIYE